MSFQHVHALSVEVRRGDMPFALEFEVDVRDDFEFTSLFWESKLCSLEGQPVLLTAAEPSLQPFKY